MCKLFEKWIDIVEAWVIEEVGGYEECQDKIVVDIYK